MWGSTDLTSFVFGAGRTEGDPIAYVTNFFGQGHTAHVVYSTANRIYELFYSQAAGGWSNADVIGFGGPAVAGDPIAYVTDFPGQEPTARIVYRTRTNTIYELSYAAVQGAWVGEDLTALGGGPPAAGDPIAYVTDFPSIPGWGPTAHVVYRANNGHVYKVAYSAAWGSWVGEDLTALGGAPPAAGDPIAYVTYFPGQGPIMRIVYRTANMMFPSENRIYGLFYAPTAGEWDCADLTALSGGAPPAGDPIVYVTNFPGQGPTARFVYRTINDDVYELFYVAARVPELPN
jgi:hypothetical protein